jgi:pilus assembly protein Flp/PilA
MKFIAKILKNTKGATAIEYGLVAALVGVAAATAFGTLGTEVGTTFGDVESELANAA